MHISESNILLVRAVYVRLANGFVKLAGWVKLAELSWLADWLADWLTG
jgi:hypothetical protein